MAVCILIFQYVAFEKSYDNFHENKDNIYRLTLKNYHNKELLDQRGKSARPLGIVMKEEFSEVLDFARLHEEDEVVVTYKENSFLEDKLYYADSTFLPMFSFSMLVGDPVNALTKPKTVVISESMVKKYFNNEDAVGKIIKIDDGEGGIDYQITGIFKDLPANLHLTFDFLMSIHGIVREDQIDQSWAWRWLGFFTYISLSPQTKPEQIENKIPQLLNKYGGKMFTDNNIQHVYDLQSVKDIYLHSDELIMEPDARGNLKIINYLTIIALFVLVLAWFNYINLSTAKSIERAKEVGIRKVTGAFRRQLVFQFLCESFIVNFIGIVLALIIVLVSHIFFADLIGKPINYSCLMASNYGIALVLVFFAGSILSGFYPAFILTKFNPVNILKGKYGDSSEGLVLRKTLTIAQFFISCVLISGAITIYKQIDFMKNHDLGFNAENIVLMHKAEVERAENFDEVEQVFFEEIRKHPNIKNVTLSFEPGRDYWYTFPIRRYDQPPEEMKHIRGSRVDYNFFDTYEIKFAAGRSFESENKGDSNAVVINEKAVDYFGFGTPSRAIDEMLLVWEYPVKVVGVVSNFHQLKLKHNIQPVCFHIVIPPGYYAIKLENAKNLQETMTFVRKKFDELLPGNPFSYSFLEDYFNRQYGIETIFIDIFKAFTILAIFIACLGLFGLSSFELIRRTKEIGIRKVLGAKMTNILGLFSKNFIKLIIISAIISIPITYLVMNKWLENYAFRINLSWWFFVVPIILILIILFITIGFQILKAANMNPVKALRYE